MLIVTVEYRRLRTFGGYQNETVGASAEVMPDESPDTALANLREWVDERLGNSEERSELQSAIAELRWKKENLERQFETAGRRWEALMAFLETLGIQRPDGIPDTLEELPF